MSVLHAKPAAERYAVFSALPVAKEVFEKRPN